MEQDIHIEDMQQSVTEYGRLRHRIEDTCREIESLKAICAQHAAMAAAREEKEQCGYFAGKFDMLQDAGESRKARIRFRRGGGPGEGGAGCGCHGDEIQDLTAKSEELLRKISAGLRRLKSQLKAVNELVEHLGSSQARWKQTAEKLAAGMRKKSHQPHSLGYRSFEKRRSVRSL